MRMKAENTQMMESENILKYVSESVKNTTHIWTKNDLCGTQMSKEKFILPRGVEVSLLAVFFTRHKFKGPLAKSLSLIGI